MAANSPKDLRLGIIGVGLKGGDPQFEQEDNFFGHLQAVQDLIDEGVFDDEARLRFTAFGDTDPGVLERLQARYPEAHCSRECLDIIDERLVDVLWIATPTASHKEYFLRAAEQGIDVYVEKPVTFWPGEIDELIRARDAHDIVCQVGLAGRHLPLVPYLAKQVRRNADKWGRLTNIVFRDVQEKPYLARPLHPSTWRKDPAQAHAGILFEHTCHDLDALMTIFGDVTRAYGHVGYYAGHEGIEDAVGAVLDLANGAVLSLNAQWTNVEEDERRVEIYFENAFIHFVYGLKGLEYQLVEKGKEDAPAGLDGLVVMADFLIDIGFPTLRPLPMEPTRFGNLLFLQSVITHQPASPSLEDAQRVQTVVEAIYRSAREGQPVELA